MFESLVEVRRESSLARKAWTLPLSLAFHATALALILIYSIFARDALLPPCTVFLSAPVEFLPVELGSPTGAEKQEAEPPVAQSPPDPSDPAAIVEPPKEQDPADLPEILLDRLPFTALFGPGSGGRTGHGDPNGVQGGRPPEGPDDNARAPRLPRKFETEAGLVSALKAVRQPQPAYPAAFIGVGLTGRVELELVVDESGRVESVTVLSATNSIFADAAVAAAKIWLFQPPVSKAGAKVAVSKRVIFNFVLR